MTSIDRKFIIFTWGCQMNEDDSEQIANLLMQMGYQPTTSAEEADVAMLVTCSVRAKPEEKAKSKLGELRLIKQRNPRMIIGVCGCWAQRAGDGVRKSRPYIDLVIGTGEIPRIPDLIERVETQCRSGLVIPSGVEESALTALQLTREVPRRVERTRSAIKSFVPVMYGCDNYCSYCVVPYVRGRERSRLLNEVVAEVRDLAARGRREVTLLGQNVNSYGANVEPNVDFADLLRAVSEVGGVERIRFTTSHPKDLSDRLIEAMRDLPKVCEHIHLAVQSGDDDVLRRMNRKYTADHVRERTAELRNAVPGVAITTDFLVGFPGESEEQFQNTVRLAEEIRFDAAFMFSFNAIPGTAAEKLDDRIPKKVANERLGKLIRIVNSITCEINEGQVGSIYEVLVEGASPRNPDRFTGLTRQNKTVNFTGGGRVGELLRVRVTEGHLYGFVGQVQQRPSGGDCRSGA